MFDTIFLTRAKVLLSWKLRFPCKWWKEDKFSITQTFYNSMFVSLTVWIQRFAGEATFLLNYVPLYSITDDALHFIKCLIFRETTLAPPSGLLTIDSLLSVVKQVYNIGNWKMWFLNLIQPDFILVLGQLEYAFLQSST